jgi:hypothetical protein
MSTADLPGLSRLLEVARKQEMPIETLPAGRFPPRAGEELHGMPVDPLLARAFSSLGKLVVGTLGSESWLLPRCDDEVNGFLIENQEWQRAFPNEFWPDHFRSLMIFGLELRYRYATVPGLANSAGFQPVVYLDPYEEIYALPIASTVDRFFDAFSRYLELIVDDPEFRMGRAPMVSFPYDVPEIIARDEPLVDLIRERRFDRLMYENNKTGWRREADAVQTQDWISKVLGEKR